MHRHLGSCSCAGSGVAPLFSEGLLASGCALVEVQGGLRSPGWLEQPKNTPLGIAGCSMEIEGPRLKSIGTCCRALRPGVASGWPRGCCGGWRVPQGCQWASGRAGGSTRRPRRRGAAWGGLGMWDRSVWGQGSSAWALLSMRVHTCAFMFMCVHACVCTELTFPRSLLWEREGMHAGEGTWDAESG